MIKSKIEARERALELAVETFKGSNRFSHNDVLEVSKYYTDFLIGEAELPEKEPSIEEITAKSIEKIMAASNAQNLGAMGLIGGLNMGGNESNS